MAMSPRLLRPVASGFSPASISGIVHWWDANDSSSLLFNSGFVESWTSKAGAKTVASQGTSNNRPATTTVNGKTALLFDGSNDGLDFTGTARTDETWIIAAAQTADQSGVRVFVGDINSYGLKPAKGSVKLLDVAFGGFTDGTDRLRPQYANNPATPLGPAVISVVRSVASGGFVFIDGTQRSGVVGGFTSFTTSKSVGLDRFGYFDSTLAQLEGWIGEVILYDRALSAAERLKVERYLGKKWGIAVA